jgi:hypothetical protein
MTTINLTYCQVIKSNMDFRIGLNGEKTKKEFVDENLYMWNFWRRFPIKIKL